MDNCLGREFIHPTREGIRTTNHAEGYHNGFRRHFPNAHPSLAEWLVTHREVHNSEELRAMEVKSGVREPKLRAEVYQAADAKLLVKRNDFDVFLASKLLTSKTWQKLELKTTTTSFENL